MANDGEQKRGLYGQRPSKSADAARRQQIARDLAMTPRERVLKALQLKERLPLLRLADSKLAK